LTFGNKLAEARKKQNITQEQLAEKLGVTRQAVSRWESDTSFPETDKIVRMAELLGVSCDYLLKNGLDESGQPVPGPVTRLLADMVGKRLKSLETYEDSDIFGYDWCVIKDFDGGWANVEFVKNRKDKRETRLIPIPSIKSLTLLKEKEG